jgi:hypothetical protein
MATEQKFYDRVARVLVGTMGGSGALNVGLSIASPLRITFDLKKTDISMMNEGTITINNLTDQTRNAIRQGMFLVLEAGYKSAGGLQTIFHGEVVDVSHNVMKPEIITTIIVQDGHTALKKGTISASYRSGTQVSQIIQDAIKKLGLPVNATSYIKLPANRIDAPFSYVGNISALLDQLCYDNGLLWSCQNGSFKIYPKDATDNLPPMTAVLIGSPKRLFKNQLSVSLDDFSGYEFNALLSPKAEPGNKVSIQSFEIPKKIDLVIAECTHKGDTHGADWMTTIKARDL